MRVESGLIQNKMDAPSMAPLSNFRTAKLICACYSLLNNMNCELQHAMVRIKLNVYLSRMYF